MVPFNFFKSVLDECITGSISGVSLFHQGHMPVNHVKQIKRQFHEKLNKVENSSRSAMTFCSYILSYTEETREAGYTPKLVVLIRQFLHFCFQHQQAIS